MLKRILRKLCSALLRGCEKCERASKWLTAKGQNLKDWAERKKRELDAQE